MRRRVLIASALIGLCSVRVFAANLPNGFDEVAVTGVIARATAMEFSPDGKLFVLEQDGTIEVYEGFGAREWDQVAPQRNFFNSTPLTVNGNGERGLLGIAFDPDYATNRFVYVYYTANSPSPHNRISRFKANPLGTRALAGSEEVLMDLENLSSANNHNGGAIHFGPDGMLYVAVGDNANGVFAQSINNRLGKILRLNPDPDDPIPGDNPTTIDGIAGTTTGLNRAIWAAGLRNPFTFAFKPGTSTMYINDVGKNTWEEIDIGAAGANYGWPTTEGPFDQATFPTFTHPLLSYHHFDGSLSEPLLSNGNGYTGMAITGGAFYTPALTSFPNGYIGDYFFSDVVAGWIKRFDPTNHTIQNFASGIAAPVDLRVGSDGALYYLARSSDGSQAGRVFRVRYIQLCLGDVAGDNGWVGVDDLQFVIANWGPVPGVGENEADITGNGVVDSADLMVVLDGWGLCP